MSEILKSIAVGAAIIVCISLLVWALIVLRVLGNVGVAIFCVLAALAIFGVTGDAARGRL